MKTISKPVMQFSSFEEQLEKTGFLLYTTVGNSMMPLLRERKDLVEIHKKVQGRRNKYDVVLYKYNGKYVLHRILKVRDTDYVITGDHCTVLEYGITDKDILGVLDRIIRDGKVIHMTDLKYRAYVHLWCDFYPIRVMILRGKAYIRRTMKKILCSS